MHNEEVAPTPTAKPKPAPPKRRSKPRKSAESIAGPTLFDVTPETTVPNKRATTSHEKTEGATEAEGGKIEHAKD